MPWAGRVMNKTDNNHVIFQVVWKHLRTQIVLSDQCLFSGDNLESKQAQIELYLTGELMFLYTQKNE